MTKNEAKPIILTAADLIAGAEYEIKTVGKPLTLTSIKMLEYIKKHQLDLKTEKDVLLIELGGVTLSNYKRDKRKDKDIYYTVEELKLIKQIGETNESTQKKN